MPSLPPPTAASPPCLPCCRATELFDWIRALEDSHPLQTLLDVYSYTAMISLCITEHDVDRALKVRAHTELPGLWLGKLGYSCRAGACWLPLCGQMQQQAGHGRKVGCWFGTHH